MKRTTVLAIETAISNGSVAVMQGSDVLASLNDVSRAELLISGINSAIADAGIAISDIDLVAVSRGPGSFTGIRIGIATGIGLARSIGRNCIGSSVFEAIAGVFLGMRKSVFISLGRNRFGVQDFDSEGRAISEPFSISALDLEEAMKSRDSSRIHFCGSDSERSALSRFENVVFVDQVPSVLIAQHTMNSDFIGTLEPIYLS